MLTIPARLIKYGPEVVFVYVWLSYCGECASLHELERTTQIARGRLRYAVNRLLSLGELEQYKPTQVGGGMGLRIKRTAGRAAE